MTGRRPQGGPPRRDLWRGGRNAAPSGRATSSPGSSRGGADRAPAELARPWVEVEELPTQSLVPTTRSRVPLTSAIAVAALIVLLAGGFGLLGGRSAGPPASPPASRVAGRPSAGTSATEPPPVPLVTPRTACSPSPDEPRQAVLEVDGIQTLGLVEPLTFGLGETLSPNPSAGGGTELPGPVEVPMDAITDIWIVGGACAVAWRIDLEGSDIPGGLRTLESVDNDDRDPTVSAQNRFQLIVAPYAGDHLLRAVLVFEQFAVRTTWFIHVPALRPPNVTLAAERGAIPTVTGCNVTQRLATDIEVPLTQCERNVEREPTRRVAVAPGEVLEFSFERWAATTGFVECGQLVDGYFVPRIEPPCIRDLDPRFEGVRFPAPEEAGSWTLAMSTCGTRLRGNSPGLLELCGTWYANIIVRD